MGTQEKVETNKTERYLAWGGGTIFTLILLLINSGSFLKYGLLANDIPHTMVYDFLKDGLREFGARSSTSRSLAYFLWYVVFGGGVFVSWKFRFKTASVVHTVLRNIHKNA